MLLCIDVGNTNIKIGVFDDDRLRHHWRIATDRNRLTDEYAVLVLNLFGTSGVLQQEITGCAIASVVPGLTAVFADVVRRYLDLRPLIVGPGIKTGIAIRTDHPAEVGSDLVANAVAAREVYGTPAIIIGFGTATTFSAVTTRGEFEGVSIAPGVRTGAEALFSFAANLPHVELTRPPHAIGKNTVHSMQSGIVFGFAGLVEGIVKRLQEELGGSAHVIATGGMAELIAAETGVIEAVEPNLALIGLRLIYDMNRALVER